MPFDPVGAVKTEDVRGSGRLSSFLVTSGTDDKHILAKRDRVAKLIPGPLIGRGELLYLDPLATIKQ